MTVTEFTTINRPEPKRDRWGRYVIPHPETGADVSWTRATTWAKTCSDTFGLTKWELRMSALGLARRPDLLALAATVTDPDDRDAKKLLDRVAADAKEAAGASARANLGTSLHSMTELIDAGTDYTVPDLYRADLDAYMDATRGLTIDRNHIERIVTVTDLLVAGTFDRLVTHNGTLMVADLKTGRDLSYSWTEIAIQLALYAHAATIWDAETGTHQPMPKVDLEQALVIHLPVGEATCTLHTVDIAAGWEMAQVCGTVRDWRKRRNLAKPLDVLTEQLEASVAPANLAEAVQEPHVQEQVAAGDHTIALDRTDWIIKRIQAVKADTPEMVDTMRTKWDATGIAKQPPWTPDEIETLSSVLHSVEQSFPATDPATPKPPPRPAKPETPGLPAVVDDLTMAPTEDVAGIKASIAGIAADDHKVSLLKYWAKQGKDNNRQWDAAANGMTVRCWNIARAAIRFLTAVGGDDTRLRHALAYILVTDLPDEWPTGAVLGSLTTPQAEELAALSDAYRAKDPTVRAVLDATAAA